MLTTMINKKKMTMDDLATKMDIDSAINKLGEKFSMKMDTAIDKLAINTDNAIGKLAIMIQKGFMDVNKKIADLRNELDVRITSLEKDMKGMHGNFDMVFQQLKEIRAEVKRVDTTADVVDLQIRVTKLEEKVRN